MSLIDNSNEVNNWRISLTFFFHSSVSRRFIAKPCALGLKVQANGPQKAQPNAILEKVFTAITKVEYLPKYLSYKVGYGIIKHIWTKWI